MFPTTLPVPLKRIRVPTSIQLWTILFRTSTRGIAVDVLLFPLTWGFRSGSLLKMLWWTVTRSAKSPVSGTFGSPVPGPEISSPLPWLTLWSASRMRHHETVTSVGAPSWTPPGRMLPPKRPIDSSLILLAERWSSQMSEQLLKRMNPGVMSSLSAVSRRRRCRTMMLCASRISN